MICILKNEIQQFPPEIAVELYGVTLDLGLKVYRDVQKQKLNSNVQKMREKPPANSIVALSFHYSHLSNQGY
ncbi:hypothetical protein SAMN05421736_12751 [Evansella caseinilytica]|uniref:Uncharacterized protein n=1 Tax=Evansella caseinilytica TaxID=1503961 RepID=A0A1H3UW96_9BACI|nr:hypothetical protein SAMN05421736_12751 [Evansella caseinilytica]